MRHQIIWVLAVLALPGVAAAEGVQADTADYAGTDLGMQLGESRVERDTPPALDLQVDPSQLPAQDLAPGSSPLDAGSAAGVGAAGPPPADRGLSFGLELKPHRYAVDGLARNSAVDQPGLQDDVERLIEHSTLGLRGTYRF
jgi:hypothetical protein